MSRGDVVVDDHLLLQVLLGKEPSVLRPRGGRLASTGLWYHRLCRALADTAVTGRLSRALGDVDDHVATATVRSVIELPDDVELLSLRTLAWPMAELVAGGTRLNLLGLEALAAARSLDAEICLAAIDDNKELRRAAKDANITVRVVRS